MGYRLNHLDEPVFIAVSKPLLTEFGIHHRFESCGYNRAIIKITIDILLHFQIIRLNSCLRMTALQTPLDPPTEVQGQEEPGLALEEVATKMS